MNVAWVYPVELTPDDNDTIRVSFPDVPEAHTFGEDAADALRQAQDALVTALAAYMADRRPLPRPSKIVNEARSVVLPMGVAAKLELYEAMREGGWKKSQLASALDTFPAQIDRLLNVMHVSRIDHLQDALRLLGRTLIVRGIGLKPGIVLPREIAPGGPAHFTMRATRKMSGRDALVRRRTSRKR